MSTRNDTKKIEKVTDINKQFIEEFILSTTNIEDIKWIDEMKWICTAKTARRIRNENPTFTNEQVDAKTRREYFASFRTKFAEKFYPDLFAEKNTKKASEDTLALAISARLAALNATN